MDILRTLSSIPEDIVTDEVFVVEVVPFEVAAVAADVAVEEASAAAVVVAATAVAEAVESKLRMKAD